MRPALTALLLFLTLPPAHAAETPADWYRAGAARVAEMAARTPNTARARNVILFVGDGMGVTTVTAARILAGQAAGGPGEDHVLSFETFPHVALIKTYTANQQVGESAGTMSALMTGIKTREGVLSVDQDVVRGDCASAHGHERVTLLEQFEDAGRATGIVSTAAITDATPAAPYAHVPERGWESDADLPPPAVAAGCRDIARQLVEFNHGDGIDVVLGGGRSRFLPRKVHDPEYPQARGERRDGRNLIAEWRRRHPDGSYLWNGADFDALSATPALPVLGLFQPAEMQYDIDRAGDPGREPSLADMTTAAIRLLSRNTNGYLLIVEGGLIDHALHEANAHRALTETAAFAHAVAAAVSLTDARDTLILVTADHSHALTFAGYPTRGNPILGLVRENDTAGRPAPSAALARDGKPYTTLGFANGPQSETPRRDLRGVDTMAPDFVQDADVPLEWETHGGEDVAAYARGPWAHLVDGVQEQNYLYHVLRHAAQLPR